MGVFSFLTGKSDKDTVLEDVYPIPILQSEFVRIDVQNIYTRIMTEITEKTQGLSDEQQRLLWDNCHAAESQDGLITLIAKAMASKEDLYVVYHKPTKIVRKASPEEQKRIREDYIARAESKVGIFLTFRNYSRTDMLKFYSALEFCSVGGLYKLSNLSHAIQIKVKGMRGAIGEVDSEGAIAQAKSVATGLKGGKSVMLDGEDKIETAQPDATATITSTEFIDRKKAFYLGMPETWMSKKENGTLGTDTGKSDAKSVDRGLRPYFQSIFKPTVDSLFGITTEFKSEDNENISVANETLKTFEITTNEIVSGENKNKIINKLYGLADNAKGDPPEKIDPNLDPNAVPGKNPTARPGQPVAKTP